MHLVSHSVIRDTHCIAFQVPKQSLANTGQSTTRSLTSLANTGQSATRRLTSTGKSATRSGESPRCQSPPPAMVRLRMQFNSCWNSCTWVHHCISRGRITASASLHQQIGASSRSSGVKENFPGCRSLRSAARVAKI